MPSVEWVEPIMTWDGRGLDAIAQPAVVAFEADSFMTDFLEAMAVTAEDHEETGADLPATYLEEIVLKNRQEKGDGSWKLYQPLHSRYYLIAGALVCRQLGLPDKEVALSDGERTTFVIRRVEGGRELAWVEGQGWTRVQNACDLYRGDERAGPRIRPPVEEQLPLHAVAADTAARAESSLQPRRRQVYYGYIPVGNRKKYTAAEGPMTLEEDPSDPAVAIQKYHEKLQEGRPNEPDYRLTEYRQRVAEPWADLIQSVATGLFDKEPDKGRIQEASLYLLLDLGDFLQKALADVWRAVEEGDGGDLDANETALYEDLKGTDIEKDGNPISLADALRELKPDFKLVNGEAGEEPSAKYDLSNPQPSLGDEPLAGAVAAALPSDTPMDLTKTKAEERLQLMKAQVPPAAAEDGEHRYHIRLVYQYDPVCRPILSAPSPEFRLASLMEPDAPARQVKIELPSIKMEDMRKFTHGVAMQMTPELRNVVNRIHKDVVDTGLAPGPVLELGMICTFSIPIITLVAFIVMFIFLIALNFIFWWLPFLRICFPIPQQES